MRELTTDDLPLRVYTVYYTALNHIPASIEGHAAKVMDNGALEILRFGQGNPFTVAIFANGAWSWVSPSPLSKEDLQTYAEVAHNQQSAALTRQALQLPGGNRVRG